MLTSNASRGLSKFVGFLALLCLVFTSMPAEAAGRVQWVKKTIKESSSGGSWKLAIKVYLSAPPGTAHLPVKFEFKPIAYYERAMMDGDKLVERRVPLTGRQDIIESVDLGFMDPGTGKLEKRTKFSFKVTRAHGFEAGEYKVGIRNARSGRLIGRVTNIKLEGENEVIDRRAMVFASGKKKDDKKKEEPASEEGSGEGTGEGSSEEGTETEPEPEPMDEDLGEDPPQEIKEKPGGCGCRVEDTRGSSHGAWALLSLGLLLLRRRQRRA